MLSDGGNQPGIGAGMDFRPCPWVILRDVRPSVVSQPVEASRPCPHGGCHKQDGILAPSPLLDHTDDISLGLSQASPWGILLGP